VSSLVLSGAPEQIMLTRGSFLPLAAVTKASLSLGGATIDVTDNSTAATFSAPVTLPQGATLLVVTTFGDFTLWRHVYGTRPGQKIELGGVNYFEQ